jgi:hypothetical protein
MVVVAESNALVAMADVPADVATAGRIWVLPAGSSVDWVCAGNVELMFGTKKALALLTGVGVFMGLVVWGTLAAAEEVLAWLIGVFVSLADSKGSRRVLQRCLKRSTGRK